MQKYLVDAQVARYKVVKNYLRDVKLTCRCNSFLQIQKKLVSTKVHNLKIHKLFVDTRVPLSYKSIFRILKNLWYAIVTKIICRYASYVQIQKYLIDLKSILQIQKYRGNILATCSSLSILQIPKYLIDRKVVCRHKSILQIEKYITCRYKSTHLVDRKIFFRYQSILQIPKYPIDTEVSYKTQSILQL